MKVSVVIPAYNEELSIAETIKAVLAQRDVDFEIIVVNNASTDKTAAVAGNFPVKIVNESRKGLLWARECGRQAAQGEIIANIDADCLPDPYWISRGIKEFADNKVSAISGPYFYYDADIFFKFFSFFSQKYIYKIVNIFLQLPFIRRGAVIIGGNNFIRASVLESLGGYNTNILFYGEDTDTARRVAQKGRVIFNPSVVMKTSARRFKSEGSLRITFRYLFYFFKVIFSTI